MADTGGQRSSLKKPSTVLLLLIALAGLSGMKLHMDRLPRASVPGSSIIYIPSGRHMKYASLGNSPLLADLIYLWAIQYFSDQKVENRFDNLDHVFGIIAELDPRYIDPYLIGAIFAAYDARDFKACFRILERGLEKNPAEWIFPFQAGHYAQMLLKDHEMARTYFAQAMEIPGAPDFTRRLYANAFYEVDDYRTALRHWYDIYREAEAAGDERVLKIASNHIYKNKAALDLEALRGAISIYKNRFSRYPRELAELKTAGLLKEIPLDLDGKAYDYNPETGEVASQLWWKR